MIGVAGLISSSNSLIGSTKDDRIGILDDNSTRLGVYTLANSNYVICSPIWNNGTIIDAGAMTWGDGNIGVTGVISDLNSIVGSKNTQLRGISVINNGDYLLKTSDLPVLLNGSEKSIGSIDGKNKQTTESKITYLPNGNFIVVDWGGVGSVSMYDGRTKQLISKLTGSTWGDNVGYGERIFNPDMTGIKILPNGNFLLYSYNWSNTKTSNFGALTVIDSQKGISGVVSSTNSLIGSADYRLGAAGITVFSDGNYVIKSISRVDGWKGIFTLMDGRTGMKGIINSCTSALGAINDATLAYNTTYEYALVSFDRSNTVNILSLANVHNLSKRNTSGTVDLSRNTFITNDSCQLIASVVSPGKLLGNTTAKVWIDSTQPSEFVKRHYEINPVTNATTANGRVTLYFTQEDFDAFNAVSDKRLPITSDDALGISNLLIEKRSGTSSDGSGLPSSYSGDVQTIDPDDSDIFWNQSAKRWEVSFEVNGFSGFFVKSQLTALPVRLVKFVVNKMDGMAQLQWETIAESNTSHFDIMRSLDGLQFETMGKVRARGTSNTRQKYTFNDDQFVFLPFIVYYRLRSVDNDGSFSESRIVALTQSDAFNDVKLYPNPVATRAAIRINITATDDQITVWNVMGHKIPVTTSSVELGITELRFSQLPAGNYFITINSEKGIYTKKMVVK